MPLPSLAPPMRLSARAALTFRALPFASLLFVSLLIVNLLQMASLLLLPFSRATFRRINRWLANTWWGWCVQVAEWNHGTRAVFSGDEVPRGERVILMANHQQMADITYLFFLARDKGRLGDLKWFAKDIIKYVPGVGWGMLFLDAIFVKRDWAADQRSINRTFSRITRARVPFWLVTFCEGTRFTAEKLEASNAFARERGLAETRHVLHPRPAGFAASVKGLRAQADAIYDVTIGYKEGMPTLWQYIQGLTRVAHLHVRRFPIAQLPEADAALGEWLRDRWLEKDELLESYYRSGVFPGKK